MSILRTFPIRKSANFAPHQLLDLEKFRLPECVVAPTQRIVSVHSVAAGSRPVVGGILMNEITRAPRSQTPQRPSSSRVAERFSAASMFCRVEAKVDLTTSPRRVSSHRPVPQRTPSPIGIGRSRNRPRGRLVTDVDGAYTPLITLDNRLGRHYVTANMMPFLGHAMKPSTTAPEASIVEKDIILDKVENLISILSWTDKSMDVDDRILTSNLEPLAEYQLGLYTNKSLRKIRPFAGVRKSGTARHHIRQSGIRERVLPRFRNMQRDCMENFALEVLRLMKVIAEMDRLISKSSTIYHP